MKYLIVIDYMVSHMHIPFDERAQGNFNHFVIKYLTILTSYVTVFLRYSTKGAYDRQKGKNNSQVNHL